MINMMGYYGDSSMMGGYGVFGSLVSFLAFATWLAFFVLILLGIVYLVKKIQKEK